MMLVTVLAIAASFFVVRNFIFAPLAQDPAESESSVAEGDKPEGDASAQDSDRQPLTSEQKSGPHELISTSPASSIGEQPDLRDDKLFEEKGFSRVSYSDDAITFTTAGREKYTAVFTNRGAVLAIYRFVNEKTGEVTYFRTPDSPMVRPQEAEMEEGAERGLMLLGPPRTLSKLQLNKGKKDFEDPLVGQNPFPERLPRDSEAFRLAFENFQDAEASAFGFRGKESWRNAVEWQLESVSEEEDHTRISYSLGPDSDGVSVKKTFEVYDAFKIVCNITFNNEGEDDYTPGVNVYGPVGIRHDVEEHQEAGIIALYEEGRDIFNDQHEFFTDFTSEFDDYLEELKERGVDQSNRVLPAHVLHGIDEPAKERLVLNGLSDGYFIAAIGIDQWRSSRAIPGGEVVSLTAKTSEQTTAVTYNFPDATLPGTVDSKINGPREASWRVVMYAGPRDRALVKQAFFAGNPIGEANQDQRDAIEWEELVSPGWPAAVSWLVRSILTWLNSNTGNVALSILLLTLIVRLSLAFLSIRAQYSMQIHGHKMKKIKPKLDAVREKYKDKKDRESQMLQFQEIRAVMKQAGVGFLPLGGCLPILLQMPIFIALFNSLRTSFMLRHESFLWMKDLARPDALLGSIEANIPLLTSQGHLTLNLLPLIWGGLMIYQQMRQPKATDPQQAQAQKMTRIIFFIFPLMWYAMPAGFMLYFVASSIYTQIESRLVKLYLIKKGIIDKDEQGVATAAMM